MKLHSINATQGLYVMPRGDGFSCYGFDVLDRKARNVATWAGLAAPTAEPGTAEHFAQCAALMAAGQAHAARTGTRCPAELSPALAPHVGHRVEVTHADGTRERFRVGRSTGWMPCHLAMRGRERYGEPAHVPTGASVRRI